MKTPFSHVPWNTPALWREANTCLAAAIARHKKTMVQCRRRARQTQRILESLFPLMDRLCRETCPACKAICCCRAWVWADFRDLLFYHLAGIEAPDRQLLGEKSDHCRFASPRGCRLERIRRPFVCTWYLCPAQTRLLDKRPAEKQRLSTRLQQIKAWRKQMEASFIRSVV